MEYVRWLLALPEPGYETAGKDEALLEWEHTMRKWQSPLWWPKYWFLNLKGRFYGRLVRLRNFLWAGTLGRWLYIKVDYDGLGSEANAIKFVASHTNIPVPRLWFTPSLRGTKYIFMSRIYGVELEQVWHTLSDEKKDYICLQLRDYMLELREIPPPSETSICSVDGGPLQAPRLDQWKSTCGPFRDEDHLNLQLRHYRPLETFPEVVQRAHVKRHPLVFTHGDLFPRNIMIDSALSGNVLAIVDWGAAGWFPSHWEYCISRNWGAWQLYQQEWMEKYVPKIIPVFKDEAEADRTLLYKRGYQLAPSQQAP